MLLFANKAGFYETKLNRAKTLTEEQIKAFEEDIKNGKENIQEFFAGNGNFAESSVYDTSGCRTKD